LVIQACGRGDRRERNVSRPILRALLKTPREGAQTQLFLAMAPVSELHTAERERAGARARGRAGARTHLEGLARHARHGARQHDDLAGE